MTNTNKHQTRAFGLAFSQPWAMQRDALDQLLAIADRQNIEPHLVEATRGARLENTRTVTVRNGVAVVPVVGPIFRYASMFTRISGATSIEGLARDLSTAASDESVRSILLEIDSPGGQAAGVHELAAQVARINGDKPVVAYVSGMAASGAYWIASAAGHVYADPTATLGSIGVVMAYLDDREAQARRGLREVKFVSSVSPMKQADPLTEPGAAAYQKIVDDMGQFFVDGVARNRGVTADAVVRDFGGGRIMLAEEAITNGMADGLSSHESTFASLARGDFVGAGRQSVAASIMRTFSLMPNSKPAAIAAISPRGVGGLVVKAQDEGMTVEAFAIAQAPARKATAQLLTPGAATRDVGAITPLAADPADEKALAVEFHASPNLRAEFGDVGIYLAFRQAEARGQVRILRRV